MIRNACRAAQRPFATSARGYQAIGSFHTPSIDDIFLESSPRPVPFHIQPVPPIAPFGHDLKAAFFLDPTWIFLNHGAFGSTLRLAMHTAQMWRDYAEEQPLKFIDRELFFHLVDSIKALASSIRASSPKDVVLLTNATAGINTVVESMAKRMRPGDSIYTLDVAYGAVKKLLHQVCSEHELMLHTQALPYAISHDDDAILTFIADTIPPDCKLVVVDHITSNTATVLPVQRIVELCHARGIPVLVDGAHGLLNLDLDVSDIGADFYVGNCHKWLCSTKGAAFLHVQPEHQAKMRPRSQSHGLDGSFQARFLWTGLQDYSALLTLPTILAYWNQASGVREYMHETVDVADRELRRAWHLPESIVPAHKRSAMRLVPLPPHVFGLDATTTKTSSDAKCVQDRLHAEFHVEVPVKCIDGRLYLRLSAHVYNCVEDYDDDALDAYEVSYRVAQKSAWTSWSSSLTGRISTVPSLGVQTVVSRGVSGPITGGFFRLTSSYASVADVDTRTVTRQGPDTTGGYAWHIEFHESHPRPMLGIHTNLLDNGSVTIAQLQPPTSMCTAECVATVSGLAHSTDYVFPYKAVDAIDWIRLNEFKWSAPAPYTRYVARVASVNPLGTSDWVVTNIVRSDRPRVTVSAAVTIRPHQFTLLAATLGDAANRNDKYYMGGTSNGGRLGGDGQVRKLCDASYKRASSILMKNRADLETLAKALLEYETLSGQEITDILRGVKLNRSKEIKKAKQ
ncbi:hypothetical protein DYB25_004537 [Aphanomyces astaci]|uniref:Aminotransferase class V domain-containing protein n=2 Tax=Aphanomyces astaci TaxID=112090 RepID=A0A397BPB7_APHAT|nr:hypothetical protein DYB25_004537 [Aphanomyces astaci]